MCIREDVRVCVCVCRTANSSVLASRTASSACSSNHTETGGHRHAKRGRQTHRHTDTDTDTDTDTTHYKHTCAQSSHTRTYACTSACRETGSHRDRQTKTCMHMCHRFESLERVARSHLMHEAIDEIKFSPDGATHAHVCAACGPRRTGSRAHMTHVAGHT